jgi:hypothetical protein
MQEEEPNVNHIERTRLPWQWFNQDIDLLELKVRGDGAMVGIMR